MYKISVFNDTGLIESATDRSASDVNSAVVNSLVGPVDRYENNRIVVESERGFTFLTVRDGALGANAE